MSPTIPFTAAQQPSVATTSPSFAADHACKQQPAIDPALRGLQPGSVATSATSGDPVVNTTDFPGVSLSPTATIDAARSLYGHKSASASSSMGSDGQAAEARPVRQPNKNATPLYHTPGLPPPATKSSSLLPSSTAFQAPTHHPVQPRWRLAESYKAANPSPVAAPAKDSSPASVAA